ncbi:hypothetical protein OHA21_07495 [Actinoplanes sp. NBC_00393]|uniref:hypothetical protein n=1 Tax=Actinoplanes sp. NBC_00393 TaxID=2975953 RepID=UPI002E20426B
MAEPVTWAVLGTVALTQGIAFLYNQAGELIKIRRERKKAAAKEPLLTPAVSDPVLAGQLQPLPVDEKVVDERSEELITLQEGLVSYTNGNREVDPASAELVAKVEALRGLLELAYQQRITFRGEEREPSGSQVDVVATAKRVEGHLVAARIDHVGAGGRVNVDLDVDEVTAGGRVIGFEGKSIGGGPPQRPAPGPR